MMTGQAIKTRLKKISQALGVNVVSKRRLEKVESLDSDLVALMQIVEKTLQFDYPSKSQLFQDLIVLLATGMKRDGYFVEFGATNGVDLSNTFLLEKNFGWKGILAEPARIWHDDLRRNRSASIDFSCVWSESDESIRFCETPEPEFSTIQDFAADDFHAKSRRNGSEYEVPTISLMDLLEKHAAPNHIDYLSIDTEGSEYDILASFDFQKYDISIITCEHNHNANRKKIFELLTSKGFERRFVSMSNFDDWYFKQGLASQVGKAQV
jgi:FkbM family methyltransferase